MGCAGGADELAAEARKRSHAVTATYVRWTLPLVCGAALAFGYSVAVRVVEGIWTPNPIAFALGIYPLVEVSKVFDVTVNVHAVAATVWLGAMFFQLISAYTFTAQRGRRQQAHRIVGRLGVTSMMIFLPTAILAPLVRGWDANESWAFLFFDNIANVLQAVAVAVNAGVGIHKVRRKEFFTHKLLMFFAAMISLQPGTGRIGIILVQLTMPGDWNDFILHLGALIGTLMVVVVSVMVSWRMGALSSRIVLVNFMCFGVVLAYDAIGCIEAIGSL